MRYAVARASFVFLLFLTPLQLVAQTIFPSANNKTAILNNEVIRTNEAIVSANGAYFATIQPDANFCVYEGSPASKGRVVWCSGTSAPVGRYLVIVGGGGNMCILPGENWVPNGPGALWCTNKVAEGATFAVLNNDGSLATKAGTPDAHGTTLWSSPAARPISKSANGRAAILPGEVLRTNESIVSPGGTAFATMQPDGNFCSYMGTPANKGAHGWCSNSVAGGGRFAVIQGGTGNMCVTPGDEWGQAPALWCTNITSNAATFTTILDDGRLQTKSGTPQAPGTVLWTTSASANGRNAVLPGEVLRTNEYIASPNNEAFAVMQGDGNFCSYRGTPANRGANVWCSSSTARAAGRYALVQGSTGNLCVTPGYEWGQGAVWCSNATSNAATFTMVDDNGIVQTQTGTPQQAGALLWAPQNLYVAIGNGKSYLGVNSYIKTGESLWSPNGLYYTQMQSDGNLCTYKDSGKALVWCSMKTAGGGQFYATQQVDGNLCVYAGASPIASGGAVWCANQVGSGGKFFTVMQGDGNLCVYPGTPPGGSGGAVWCHNSLMVAVKGPEQPSNYDSALAGQYISITNKGPAPVWVTIRDINATGSKTTFSAACVQPGESRSMLYGPDSGDQEFIGELTRSPSCQQPVICKTTVLYNPARPAHKYFHVSPTNCYWDLTE